MTPDEVRMIIRDELQELLASDRYIFHKNIQVLDGRNIQVGKTTGMKIGTESTQKIGFYGVTPVSQFGTIASPSGGGTQDSQARTAIDLIRSALSTVGIIQ